MERLRHEPRTPRNQIIDDEARSHLSIEKFSLRSREVMEKRFKADPKDYHSRLIYQGFWHVAAQLKTDYEAGRL